MSEFERNQLAERMTITRMVKAYEVSVQAIRGAFAQVAAAEHVLNNTFVMGGYGHIRAVRSGHSVDFGNPEEVLLHIRHEVWAAIIERTEVRGMMSCKRRAELDEMIDKKQMPEITEQSVSELLTGFFASLDVMLEESVAEVFDWVRPREGTVGSKYARNRDAAEGFEVPEKIVLAYIVERWGKYCHAWSLNYRRGNELIALQNVFSALDGHGVCKEHWSDIEKQIKTPGFDGEGETPYFKFRVYQNGNMHLTFKRLDLLARFNAIAGGARLRPARPSASPSPERRTEQAAQASP